MSVKLQYDEVFYNGITEKIPNWLKELANSYGIDFNNFKNLCELKLAAQKELVKKQLQLEAARTVMNTVIGNKTENHLMLVDVKTSVGLTGKEALNGFQFYCQLLYIQA